MEFSRQDYWSGLPFPGYLPDPGIKPASLAFPALTGDALTVCIDEVDSFHCATWEAPSTLEPAMSVKFFQLCLTLQPHGL